MIARKHPSRDRGVRCRDHDLCLGGNDPFGRVHGKRRIKIVFEPVDLSDIR